MKPAHIIEKEKRLRLVPRSEVKKLSRVNSLKSVGLILLDWLIILTTLTIAILWFHPLTAILAFFIIGGRQNALWAGVHEGSHYLISRNKRLNDWITRIFCAWPIFISLDNYRKLHLGHHQELKSEYDTENKLRDYPEFKFPKSKRELILIFLKDFTGINFFKYTYQKIGMTIRQFLHSPKDTAIRFLQSLPTGQLIYYAIGAVIITYLDGWLYFLLFWFLPYVSLLSIGIRLRLLSDHFFTTRVDHYETRTVRLRWWEKFFLTPRNLNLHTEHHIYPSIPCYNLPKVHALLSQKKDYQATAHLVNGYGEVFRELLTMRQIPH